MTLALHLHPLSSYCQKVLVALYENGTPFERRLVALGDPAARAEYLALSPMGKIPALHDAARSRTVIETTVIIEYLDRHYPGPRPLLPAEPEARLEARLWDRVFDLYVQTPMQKIVGDRLRDEGERDARGVAEARATLDAAYRMIDARLADRVWAAGEEFGLADCAAAPALFYAGIVAPFPGERAGLAAYFERLLARPSVARTIADARPYFDLFPYRDAMPARLRVG
jgi:glutathione S-transferase